MKFSPDFIKTVSTILSESSVGDFAPKDDWNPEPSFTKKAESALVKHGWKETHGIGLYSHPKYGKTIADTNSGSLVYHIGGDGSSEGSKIYDVHPKDVEAHLHEHIGKYHHIMTHKEAAHSVGGHVADKYAGLYGSVNDDYPPHLSPEWHTRIAENKKKSVAAKEIAVKHGADKDSI